MSCDGCEIPGTSGFAFHSSQDSKDLSGWLQSGRVLVAWSEGSGYEDKPNSQMLEVEDCSWC